MRVLSKVPGYGGKYICEVIGEDEKNYALAWTHRTFNADVSTAVFYNTREFPPDMTPANSHYETEYFTRKKSKCVVLTAAQQGGSDG